VDKHDHAYEPTLHLMATPLTWLMQAYPELADGWDF
jgi:hypothetical protein